MFFEVELLRDIAVPAKSVDRNELRVPQRYTVPRLLEGWINQKACKDHGYFLSVTKSKSIDKEGPTVNGPGVVSFPVIFMCRTFLPVKGEILHGVVMQHLHLSRIAVWSYEICFNVTSTDANLPPCFREKVILLK